LGWTDVAASSSTGIYSARILFGDRMSRLKEFEALLIVLAYALSLLGCGGSSTGRQSAQSISIPKEFVFAAQTGTNSIITFSLDTRTGKLTEVASVSTPNVVNNMIVDPRGRFLYAGNGAVPFGTLPGDTSLYGYSINPSTGVLTPITGSPFAVGYTFSMELQTDSNGKFLYMGGSLFNTITALSIDQQTGALSPLAIPSNNPVSKVAEFLATKNGMMLSVSTSGTTLSSWDIDPNTGAWNHLIDISIPNQSVTLAVDPSGKFVYANSAGFMLDPATGSLMAISGQQPAPTFFNPVQPFAYSIDVSSSSKYAVAGFSLNTSNGQLTPLPSAITGGFATGTVDASGKFVVLCGMQVFAVDSSTGGLTPVQSPSLPSVALATYPPVQVSCGPLGCSQF